MVRTVSRWDRGVVDGSEILLLLWASAGESETRTRRHGETYTTRQGKHCYREKGQREVLTRRRWRREKIEIETSMGQHEGDDEHGTARG